MEDAIIELSTHFKGRITELLVERALLDLGHQVSEPIVQNCRYDLIADIHNQLYRIQVKTSLLSKGGDYITFRSSSSHTNTKRTRSLSYDSDEIDYFATEYNGQCYVVPVNVAGKSQFRLRLTKPKNNQEKYIHYADDYKIEKIFS